jgi:CheY-like chemotaxis protein
MANTILVVDDNLPSIADLVDELESSGLTTVTADGFDEALKVLADIEPELLITSLRLGPYNGLHLIMRTRALYPNAAAILIGPPDPMATRDAMALGAAAYVTSREPKAIVIEALKVLNRTQTADDGDIDGANGLGAAEPGPRRLMDVPL